MKYNKYITYLYRTYDNVIIYIHVYESIGIHVAHMYKKFK